MKKYILTFFISFMLGISLFFMSYLPVIRPLIHPEIHIFLEAYATNPALSQMIEFSKLPKKTRKFIAWHRFPNRKNVLDLANYNTTEVDLPATERLYSYGTHQMLKAIDSIIQNEPMTEFILHANFSHIPVAITPFLNKIPKHRIKHIHLYEDGYGVFYKGYNVYRFPQDQTEQEILNELNNHIVSQTGQWKAYYELLFFKLYPTTYHLFEPNFLYHIPKYAHIAQYLKQADVQEINFYKLRNTLSDEQKDIIYRLSGFDYQKYNKLMRDKKTFIFVLGYHFDNKDRLTAEENLLKSLHDGSTNYLKNPEEYTWFYKPHPSYSAATRLNQIRTAFPEMIEIPAQLPFEVFILAGLKPTLTSGFSSSLFYSLNSQDILMYVQRPGDIYQPFLIETGKLKPEQIISYKNFLTQK